MGSRPRDFNMKQILPRDYQAELVERAVSHNTIVSLGTSATKMFVAVQLIKEHAHWLFNSDAKAFFLVDSALSIDERANHIEFHSSLKVARLLDEFDRRPCKQEELKRTLGANQCIVLTAKMYLEVLLTKQLFDCVRNTVLLIIDECHLCLGEAHPYREIMQIHRTLDCRKPRVLGLTASLLNEKVPLPVIERTVLEMERTLDARLETASDLAIICKYVRKPKQFVVCANNDVTSEKFVVDTLEKLRCFVEKNGDHHSSEVVDIDARRPILEAVSRAYATLQRVGTWCALRGCMLWQKKLAKLAEEPLLAPRQRCLLRTAETSFRTCTRVLNHRVAGINSYAKLVAHSQQQQPIVSDRVEKLLAILQEYSPAKRAEQGIKESLSILIFVKERFIAFMINTLLKSLIKWEPEQFGSLKVDFLVGHSGLSGSEEEDRKLANKKQEQTLQKFRSGQLNVLIATSVLEEGIDIRNCNLVIRFDAPTSFRSYIQSGGRARRENGVYYIIVEERDYAQFSANLENYAKIEQFILRHYRSGNATLCEKEIAAEPELDARHSPYAVESAGGGKAQVTLTAAIPLVNRYCSKLPSDVFTRLVPHYRAFVRRRKGEDGGGRLEFEAQLLLPINSALKGRICLSEQQMDSSVVPTSKSVALMLVALEACKRLHQRKELNDQLQPTGREVVTDLLGELDDDEEYLPCLIDKIGSSKRRRLYDRKMSKSLIATLPGTDVECHLYVIEMRLVRPISEENNPKKRRIIDPYETNCAFGFLSCKELPAIPGFPVYQRQGEMLVRIRKASKPVVLSHELFQLICLFHEHLFEDILRIARGGVAFAPQHSPTPLLIAPLKRDGPSDLDYVLDTTHLRWNIREQPTQPSLELRRKFVFDESNYTDAVVMPWYRAEEQCAYYYVAEICRDQSPNSAFPDTKFSSFNEYFLAKYQLQIFDQNQCLLDVDHTSARMNLLLPRASSGRSTKRPLDPSQRQILVPELVHIHPLNAPLWTMIVALPTVLYRMNSLLLADEFRVRVVQDALKASENGRTDGFDWEWPPLVYATPNSGEGSQQPAIIKNLDQLKKVNREEEEEREKRGGTGTSSDGHVADVAVGGKKEEEEPEQQQQQFDFEIGVWDPDGLGETSEPSTRSGGVVNGQQQETPRENGHTAPNGLRNGLRQALSAAREEEISELIAIGNDYSLHSYGDMSDEDDDLAEYNNFRFMMHDEMSNIDFGDLDSSNVRARGWNEEDDDFNNICIENETLPLTISLNNPDINIMSLMSDLEKNFAGPFGGTVPQSPSRGTPSTVEKNNANGEKQSRPPLVAKKLHLDALTDEQQDAKKASDEEVLAEAFFCWEGGKQESQISNGEECDEQLELMPVLLGLGETPDLDASLENSNFEVFAPEISGWMPFSFMESCQSRNPYGVSPTLLLQALTTSSASDGINLERLETIGDSFLKMAVTNYLYYAHPEQHEGKLSFARSKEVSNSRLFYLGRQHNIPVLMETSKFDPHVNWLPPCYASTSEFHALNPLDLADLDEGRGDDANAHSDGLHGDAKNAEKKKEQRQQHEDATGWGALEDERRHYKCEDGVETITFPQQTKQQETAPDLPPLPYNMLTQQWISDKSIADAVEALIGAHLIQLGQQAALKFMGWLGIRVLTAPPALQSPLLRPIDTSAGDANRRSLGHLKLLYRKFDFCAVERTIGYSFANKAYLIQAFTHASYTNNRITGCYQRLEFLGDAVLDYMITRFLFEHQRQYSPGVLTDLRSSLVNNTIFASLAVKHNFHKHFMMLCPPLYQMIEKFVNFCKQKDFLHCANFDDEIFMITEDEIDEGHEEDVEVPKAMGDIFESVAGAVYLDCGMDLDIVWRVFYGLMREVIEKCCASPPQSPVRELFERKNCKAKFAKLERKLETGKVRVTVTINDNLQFTGMGRNYRIAKCTAAKRALQHLRKLDAAKSEKGKKKANNGNAEAKEQELNGNW